MILFITILILAIVVCVLTLVVFSTRASANSTPTLTTIPTPNPIPSPDISVSVTPYIVTILYDTFTNSGREQVQIITPEHTPEIGTWILPFGLVAPVINAEASFCRGFPPLPFSYGQVGNVFAFTPVENTLSIESVSRFSSSMVSTSSDYYIEFILRGTNKTISWKVGYYDTTGIMNVIVEQVNDIVAETVGQYDFPSPIFDTDITLRITQAPNGTTTVSIDNTLVSTFTVTNPIPSQNPDMVNIIFGIAQVSSLSPTVSNALITYF